jgi:alkaline phosphatase D
MHFGDSARRGYVLLDVTPELCTAQIRVIGDPADRQTGVTTAATFAIDAGRPGARRVDV